MKSSRSWPSAAAAFLSDLGVVAALFSPRGWTWRASCRSRASSQRARRRKAADNIRVAPSLPSNWSCSQPSATRREQSPLVSRLRLKSRRACQRKRRGKGEGDAHSFFPWGAQSLPPVQGKDNGTRLEVRPPSGPCYLSDSVSPFLRRVGQPSCSGSAGSVRGDETRRERESTW